MNAPHIGPYELGHLIGRGGMGEVFAGFDPRLERPVAIKRIPARGTGSEREFLNEARHAARLSHPNIVRLYDVVRLEDSDYIISELVDGRSLSQTLAAQELGRLPIERAVHIALGIADALAHAHEHGVVHRDVKSANVLLGRQGEVKLADFGVAASVRGLGPPSEPVASNTLSGTVFAMSPEQTLGEYTDARSDLFSFGVLVYELVSGISPFLSPDAATSLRSVRETRPLPLVEVLPEVPARLSKLVERLLEKRREDRPESAREVQQQLEIVQLDLRTTRQSELPAMVLERQLAVACVCLTQTNDFAAHLTALAELSELVTRAGGALLSGAGRIIVFVFGYPTPQENNCEAAIRLLLELQSKPAFSTRGFAAGVDCGVVRVVQRAQSVLASGDAIDYAMRLAEVSETNTISLTLAAQSLVRRFFRCTSLKGPAADSGRNRPVYRVLEKLSPDAGIEQVSTTPLCARTPHIEQLDRAFEDAQLGLVVTRLLVGDAGVGKSRVLHEWRRSRWQAVDLVLNAYATANEQRSPFAPLVRLWRDQFAVHLTQPLTIQNEQLTAALARSGLDEPRLAPTLQYTLGIAGPDNPLHHLPAERRRHQIVDVFVWLVLELARGRLVVLCVEDIHFVDRSTLDVLRRIAESPESARLLILLTARPEFLDSWPFSQRIAQIGVDRLSSSDALRLIESMTGGSPLPAAKMRQLVELGDGIPLALEELTRAVVANYEQQAPTAEFYSPTSLADSVMRRVEQLGAARQLACTAALFGRESSVAQLLAVVGVGEVELQSRLRKLDAAGLVHVRDVGGEQRCFFSHALVHEAVRSAIAAEEATRLYSRIVEVLDRQFLSSVESAPERFAHIYAGAGALERALQLHEAAASRAIQQCAHHEASAHLQTALLLLQNGALGSSPSIERRLRQVLGPCLMALEGWSSHVVADNLARSRALLAGERGELRELWGMWAHGIVTHEPEAVGSAIESIRYVPASIEQQFTALSMQGVTAFYRGQFRTARAFLEQAVAMLPSRSTAPSMKCVDLTAARSWGGEFAVSAALHLAWMEALSERGDRARHVHRHAEELLVLLSSDADDRELRHALYMRIHLGLTFHDYEYYDYVAYRHGSGALHRLFEVAGSQLLHYRCVAQIGEARARAASGDPQALADLTDAYRRMKALSRRPTGHVFFASVIAEAQLEAGHTVHADHMIQEAIGATQLEYGRFYAAEAYRVAAERRLQTGELASAQEALRQARSALMALDAPAEVPALYFERRIAETERLLSLKAPAH